MGVTTVLQNIAGRQDRALLEATKKSDESKPYDECDIAALMGYCGVRSPDEVPAVWPQLKQTKKPVDQRALILNAMEQWSFDERKEIDTTFFLAKEVLEDIMKIQPNDTNTVGMNSTTARGVSNLVVLPRRMAEIETMMKLEEAADKTEYSRTLKEAERLAKAETRAPPEDLLHVKAKCGYLCRFSFCVVWKALQSLSKANRHLQHSQCKRSGHMPRCVHADDLQANHMGDL
jgi:hypothetical protein